MPDFSCMDEEGNFLTVKCDYDFMGRRVFKKVISGTGTVTSHQRFIYRGYLQIACVDLTRTNHPALWLITWDPTEPVATRPLAIQKDGTWYTYGLDLTKNVCEVFGATGYIRTAYTYSPYGSVTATGNVTQPIQWSSEFYDEELGLVYYNWRYYNIGNGRWTNYDYFESINKYKFDSPVYMNDYLGLEMYVLYDTYFNKDHYNKYKKERPEDLISKVAYTTIYDIINESYEIKTRKEGDYYVAYITNISDPLFFVYQYVPKANKTIAGVFYNENSIKIVKEHENRRLQVYKLADKEYYKKLKSNLAKLTYKDKDECIAKNELEIIAVKYVAAVEKQFLAYIKVENEIITREAMEKNLIFANNVYGTRTLVGINSTHKINPPAPIIKAEDFLLKK